MSTATQTPTGCLIHVDAVSKSFSDSSHTRCVLSDISVAIEPGEIVSFIGRSGIGKSTFLRLLSGLTKPDSGGVTINQRSADAARRQKMVGFMPQSPALLSWRTVAQNVNLVRRVNRFASTERFAIDDILRAVGLYGYEGAYPSQLSGGMQHRVALARTIATNAPFLALDEPFSSLDELTRSRLYDLVLQIWSERQCTIAVVTHNLDEAVLLSDRVIVLGGSPATIKGVVRVNGERSRRSALDRGEYAGVLSVLRALLAEDDV